MFRFLRLRWNDVPPLTLLMAALAYGAWTRIRLLHVLHGPGSITAQDETNFYYAPARNLLDGFGFIQNGYESVPPLQALLYYLFLRWLPSADFADMRVVQAVLSIATLGLFALCAWQMTRSFWAAAAAAVLLVVNLDWAFLPGILGAESNFLFLFFAALTVLSALLASPEERELPRGVILPLAAAAGILLGLATLQRSQTLYLAPVAAAMVFGWQYWNGERRRGILAAVLLFAGFAAVTAPWALRNLERHGAPLIGDTRTQRVIAMSNYAELDSRAEPFWEQYYYRFEWMKPEHEAWIRATEPVNPYRTQTEYDNRYGASVRQYAGTHPGHFLRNVAFRAWNQLHLPAGVSERIHRAASERLSGLQVPHYYRALGIVSVLALLLTPLLVMPDAARGPRLMLVLTTGYFFALGAIVHITEDGRMNLTLRWLLILLTVTTATAAVRLMWRALGRRERERISSESAPVTG